jgi:hypothetical protein
MLKSRGVRGNYCGKYVVSQEQLVLPFFWQEKCAELWHDTSSAEAVKREQSPTSPERNASDLALHQPVFGHVGIDSAILHGETPGVAANFH